MNKRMLIDAMHPEEIRVAVVDSSNRLEEFDSETTTKKSLKGNIYLAKIIRVEPSLQAAFVEYGGNRNGFLPFTEIHPDYFRIPVEDRQKTEEKIPEENSEDLMTLTVTSTLNPNPSDTFLDTERETETSLPIEISSKSYTITYEDPLSTQEFPVPEVETIGGSEIEEENNDIIRRPSFHRRYKIQEVIQRNQIILVQVTKEERGGKGAALTTYLSLAGRYCVLMPNSPRSGGISRKISSAGDRKRLRNIIDELNLPAGMSLIVRTAGKERSKIEVKRDAEYLFRTWDNIRELTLQSTAPALTYEEASLIKRSIRDIYSKDIKEILVEGEEAYRIAKNFMKELIPSHSKKVQRYTSSTSPIFHAFKIESQIDEIYKPVVQLPSGGYLVINPTEALISIDINSGRSTRERHIEETALRTNLEAADEIARQLRLRDLAGLVVIDFIDMEDLRHNAAVEKRLKEAMQHDRARIQIGSISPFGLLEMSRQRLRPSLLESSTITCRYCQGSGLMRSKESSALEVLRALEEEALTSSSKRFTVSVPLEVGLYILNQKRCKIVELEARHGIETSIQVKESLIPPQFEIFNEDRAKAHEPVQSAKKQPSRVQVKKESSSQHFTRQLQKPITSDTAEINLSSDAVKSSPASHKAENGAVKPENLTAGVESPHRTRRRGRRGGRHRNRYSHSKMKAPEIKTPQANGHSEGNFSSSLYACEEIGSRGPGPQNSEGPSGNADNTTSQKEGISPVKKSSTKQKSWWQRILD